MPAYFIAQYSVDNPALYAEYQAGAGPTLAAHGAELVAFDVAAETMEGTAPGAQTVVIKFESTEAAKGWYNSKEQSVWPCYLQYLGKNACAPVVLGRVSFFARWGRACPARHQ